VAAPIARGYLKGEYLESAAQAKFFGAKISETFLGSDDLKVKLVTVLLIFVMSATTFTTQRQLMTKGMPKMDSSNNMMLQQQKIMLYLFPVIFAVSGVNFPVGVLIYWSTTNFWTWGQQYYVIKRNPTPGSPAFEELERKKAKKKGETLPPDGVEGNTIEGENPGATEIKGQRNQPKKKKKKKNPKFGHLTPIALNPIKRD
jgi:YidC/Oxa1 family membrane protein insertase